MKKEKERIAVCDDCEIFFSFSREEIFSRATFCPACSGRAHKSFASIKEARSSRGKLPLRRR